MPLEKGEWNGRRNQGCSRLLSIWELNVQYLSLYVNDWYNYTILCIAYKCILFRRAGRKLKSLVCEESPTFQVLRSFSKICSHSIKNKTYALYQTADFPQQLHEIPISQWTQSWVSCLVAIRQP